MALTYAKATPVSELDPAALGVHLAELIGEALVWLEEVSDARAAVAPAEGKWCAKEVIGHLVDSAVNNLQRIIRLETVLDIEPEVTTQHYEQEEWVRAQRYIDKNWMQVLTLWLMLNEHLAWTMRYVSRKHLTRICVFPDTHMTLGFLMEDYIAHLEHHLNALKLWI